MPTLAELANLPPAPESSLASLGVYGNAAPQQTGRLAALGQALGQTWPARLAKDIYSAVTLPGDAYQGNVSMWGDDGHTNPEVIKRSADLGGVVMGGGIGGTGAESGMVLGSAATRAAKNVDELRSVLAKDFPQVNHFVSERPQSVSVSKVVVPPEVRGQGVGTTFMRDVIDYADARGKPVALTPSSDFGGNLAQLREWYGGLGFIPNKGRKADHSISESMYRPVTLGSGATDVKGASLVQGANGIRAYHGSPHDFDKFDLSKIGTGEGAQTYGQGLYFAENEAVARQYRDNLTKAGEGWFEGGRLLNDAESLAAHNLQSVGGDRAAALARIDRAGKLYPPEQIAAAKDAALRLDPAALDVRSQGKMYEVNVNADPAKFMDYDKPLGAQPELWGKFRDAGLPLPREMPEAWAGKSIGDFAPQHPSVARAMADAGIPGIRYLDSFSRVAGGGSRNMVVFDDKMIEILRKYGLAGLPAAGVAGAAINDQGQSQ
jgi:GNAT superfamily N-acetyltransferase